MKKFLLLFAISFLVFGCNTNQNQSKKIKFPTPLGYVSDYDNVLTHEQINELTNIISEYKSKTTNEIAIVSISENLTEDNFDQFALDLANHWGVGTAEKNNGLAIIFSKQLRRIRICTGIGTEKILTDKICEKVLHETIIPEFKNENHYLGLKNGINEFIKLWE